RDGVGEPADGHERRATVERFVTEENALRRSVLEVRAVVHDVGVADRLRRSRRRRSFEDLERSLPGAADARVDVPLLTFVVAPRDLRTAEPRRRRGEPQTRGRG